MIQLKMKGLKWSQYFLHYKSMGDFSRRLMAANSAVLGPICPNFELDLEVMDVRVTCMNKIASIENKSARVVARFSPL